MLAERVRFMAKPNEQYAEAKCIAFSPSIVQFVLGHAIPTVSVSDVVSLMNKFASMELGRDSQVGFRTREHKHT